ncbi:thioester domain-containing protein [Anaerotignum sp.]|uniref:thioester domain-containing protein n=1 Tax=Anaerotignum sp. TaxID=2039241 RepID=UPI0028A68689|nr:thioester domain-containing protein [Anaerotignum sp.]
MGMPIITGSGTTREQAITDLIESVALEQASISYILDAEATKFRKALLPCANFNITSENHMKYHTFRYNGTVLYWGISDQGMAFAIFELVEATTGLTTSAYCFDVFTAIAPGLFEQQILTASSDISEENANKVRNILFNAFPYASVSTIQNLSGIQFLTQGECITAAQLAIWRYSNNFYFDHSNARVRALLAWYLSLPPIGIIIDPEKIYLTGESIFQPSGCAAKFTFSTPALNADGSPVSLAYTFDKDLTAAYGAHVDIVVDGDLTTITVTQLPPGATFVLTVEGAQSLPQDAYRYVDTQDLVGLFTQTNDMIAQAKYECIGDCGANLVLIHNSIKEMVNAVSALEAVMQTQLALAKECLCEEEP